MGRPTLLAACLFVLLSQQASSQLIDSDFNPQVSATCKADHTMHIRVSFNQSFYGIIHARDYRTSACMNLGDGGQSVTLNVSLLAPPGSAEYCGLLINNRTQEKSLPVAVRVHKTLELADDKFYVITCGKAGPRNQSSPVSLNLLDGSRKVTRAVYSNPYTLRIETGKMDASNGFRVKNCFAFNKINTSVPLVDDRGCPSNGEGIGKFVYDDSLGIADAKLRSMFKFPESSEVFLQCDVAFCKGACPRPSCNGDVSNYVTPSTEEGTVIAGNTVFVLDPGEAPLVQELCDEERAGPGWLLWLCIALGVLFLIMLIINIFLCSAMTCACTRTEIIEKEPSIIEDYDPYRSWHGSQYGSRYSLNGAPPNPKGYTSGGSTMNSARSVSSHSDHYAIVHSRPGSRGYGKQRGPSSHVGSHYSGK
ncbi:uncharacterized protein LOC132703927 [Cylas formicarius]|uniref:uncharacterized protein LOC132703927 n=1 Tax=Cylas formicarius TaxID=197179 RepID=UPI002958D3CC|nr:uncharacterized protein LOC132703927 [Cylas formicarius]